MLLEAVRAAIERYRMIELGDRVVVAVSGGADSIALLHALCALTPELGCSLFVAHLDHGLRSSSGDDARFVADAAAALGLPMVSERADVAALAASRGQGIEEAGREARREFLSRVADELGAVRVALGHTADDQAETILYRLARGTGWEGMCGMASVSGRFIRPLLSVSREEVRTFAAERGLRWREDETNADVRFARNRIRERILPELNLAHPGATRAIARSAELAREAREVERYALDRVWPTVCEREEAGSVHLRRRELATLPPAMRSAVLRDAMRRTRGGLRGIGRAHVAAVARLATSPALRGEQCLPRLRAVASPASLELSAVVKDAAIAWTASLPLGRTALAEPQLVVNIAVCERDAVRSEGDPNPWAEMADADCVQFPLVARCRRPGDRFAPLGMDRDVRLKSFLANARIPVERRDRLALVCDRDKIVWVVGVRLSDAVKMRPSTRRVLVLRAEEVER
jgi:tRNA(Ile)-lysidine synthase